MNHEGANYITPTVHYEAPLKDIAFQLKAFGYDDVAALDAPQRRVGCLGSSHKGGRVGAPLLAVSAATGVRPPLQDLLRFGVSPTHVRICGDGKRG